MPIRAHQGSCGDTPPCSSPARACAAMKRRLEQGQQREEDGGETPWCRRGDSNPHGLPHTPLKRARLPVPPLRHELYYFIFRAGNVNGKIGRSCVNISDRGTNGPAVLGSWGGARTRNGRGGASLLCSGGVARAEGGVWRPLGTTPSCQSAWRCSRCSRRRGSVPGPPSWRGQSAPQW